MVKHCKTSSISRRQVTAGGPVGSFRLSRALRSSTGLSFQWLETDQRWCKTAKTCKHMDIIWINHDKFNDNFNYKSSFDVKNAEAPFNCSFKMKIQSKRKKFEHVCTASGSGRNYKCDLVPGFWNIWLYYNPIVGPHSCRQPTNQCFIPRWNLLRQAAERERLSSPPMSWSWKKHELLVTIFNSGGYWTIQLFQLPRLHRIIGSGHSFHFWLNEDP